MAKPKNLSNIKIKEVSLVDLPANKLPFLFFKRDGAKVSQFVKAKKKITIEIESNGMVGGTKVKVNGDDLGKLRSFDFSFYGDDPKQAIHASYSKVTESVDGFSRTETYYLTKGKPMNEKTLKALKKYLGTDEIDFEKKVDEEEIQKAITLISEHYQDSFPEDLVNAVGVIAKCAASSYAVKTEDVAKAGARLSKDMIKKLKAIIEALAGLMPDESQFTSTKKSDTDGETSELEKQIAELKEAIVKLDPAKKDDDKSSLTELTKQLKEVSESVSALEKGDATKKGITGDDTDNDEPKGAGEKGEILWKSFQPQKSD
jgi:hypothetical protein